jgi:hypothetical protein
LPDPYDQWDPLEEEADLARWEELIAIIERALPPPARPSADPPIGSSPGDPATAGATHTAKGTPDTPERRRGQALTADEKKLYLRIIRQAKRLKLPSRMPGNVAKIAAAAAVDREIAIKALRWGRRHSRL